MNTSWRVVLGYVLVVGAALRAVMAFLADLASVPEGWTRLLAILSADPVAWVGSAWFQLLLIVVGLTLIWSGSPTKPVTYDRITAMRVSHQERIHQRRLLLDQLLPDALEAAMGLLRCLQEDILTYASEAERRALRITYSYQLRYYETLVQLLAVRRQPLPLREDPKEMDELLREFYAATIEISEWVDRLSVASPSPVPSSPHQRFIQAQRELEHLLNAAWGTNRREKLANEAAKKTLRP